MFNLKFDIIWIKRRSNFAHLDTPHPPFSWFSSFVNDENWIIFAAFFDVFPWTESNWLHSYCEAILVSTECWMVYCAWKSIMNLKCKITARTTQTALLQTLTPSLVMLLLILVVEVIQSTTCVCHRDIKEVRDEMTHLVFIQTLASTTLWRWL